MKLWFLWKYCNCRCMQQRRILSELNNFQESNITLWKWRFWNQNYEKVFESDPCRVSDFMKFIHRHIIYITLKQTSTLNRIIVVVYTKGFIVHVVRCSKYSCLKGVFANTKGGMGCTIYIGPNVVVWLEPVQGFISLSFIVQHTHKLVPACLVNTVNVNPALAGWMLLILIESGIYWTILIF